MIDLRQLEDLYDRGSFMQAYRLTEPYWNHSTDLNCLSIDELLLASRLAARLGGVLLSRHLWRAAHARDPSNPHVRYLSFGMRRRGKHFASDLRDFEENTRLGDIGLQAWWLASYAVLWAHVRDFERANDCIDRARALAGSDSWVLACGASAAVLADRRDEALELAEQACAIDSGVPYVVAALCESLVQLGRLEEAAERASKAAEADQSYEVGLAAYWHLCLLAETLGNGERAGLVERAARVLESVPALAPLADRRARSVLAKAQLDVAWLLGDSEETARRAAETGSPFWRRVAANLRSNPAGNRIRLAFRHAQQRHGACLPTSISSALSAMGIQINADEMAAEITYGGTPGWAAAEWLESHGLAVRVFIVNAKAAAGLIGSGIPFVLTLMADDFSHAVAAIGLDEAAGTLSIHDPAGARLSACLLEDLGRNDGPLGPLGMAAAPKDKADLLDSLLADADPCLAGALFQWQKALDKKEPEAARAVIDNLVHEHPSHPGTRCMQSVQALQDGRGAEALAGLQKILNDFPNSPFVRRNLLSACVSIGNAIKTRQVLADIVERAALPGVHSVQEWQYPPSTYICMYADHLRQSAETRRESHAWLNWILDRQGGYAEAWHVLGKLCWQERDRDGSLLAFRLASCLETHNETYAQAYSSILRGTGKEQDAVAWLQARVDESAGLPRASGPWTSLIEVLEAQGDPEGALAACNKAVGRDLCSPELLASATGFYARIGAWPEAEACLRRAKDSPFYFMAAALLHAQRGELNAAITHCGEWLRHFPRSISMRSELLDLIAKRDGERAAAETARSWLMEHPDHDEVQQFYYIRMEGSARWKADLLLARRTRRNRDDAWAWQQRVFRALSLYARGGEGRRQRLNRRIPALLAECVRTEPYAPATAQAKALWQECLGRWPEAIASWLEAIDEDPDALYSYQHLWACSSRSDDQARRAIFEELESRLARHPRRLSSVGNMLFLFADRFGAAAAEEAAERWLAGRPNDPDAIKAAAGLFLGKNRGRPGARRARAILKPATSRFPHHTDLALLLAQAHDSLGEGKEACVILREAVRRHPCETRAYLQLAEIYDRAGERDESRRLLETAAVLDPYNPELGAARASTLIRDGNVAGARESIRKVLLKAGEGHSWHQSGTRVLLEGNDMEGAVELAREGARLHPNDAFYWWLLAETLRSAVSFAAAGEIESCLRRALSLDASVFTIADGLATILTESEKYEEAAATIQRTIPQMPDPSPAYGRLAWIHYQSGSKDDAVKEMSGVVGAAPWYLWGWKNLTTWLREGQRWEAAREILSRVPPEVRSDAQFRAQRVIVLEGAGIPSGELDMEWSGILQDFPEEVPLYLERYDRLRAARRRKEAAEVLYAIRPVEPDNPFMLARLVEAFAEGERKTEAIQALGRVLFAGEEWSTWPAEYAWKAAERMHLEQEAYREARRLLSQGSRPTPHGLSLMAAYAMDQEFLNKKARQQPWRVRFPGPGAREVLDLLCMADRAPWASGQFRVALFRRLAEYGYHGLVVRYWKLQLGKVEGDIEAWEEVGRALVSSRHKREARRVLAGWRDHPGAHMATIVNYIGSFSHRSRRNQIEVLRTCKDALEKLTHDHCAKYLAHVQAEMCGLLRDTESFQKTWTERRRYFDGKVDEGEWFEQERSYLLGTIPRMGRLLEQNRMDLFQQACRDLRKGGVAVAPVTVDSTRGTIPWLIRIIVTWLGISLLARLLNELFKQ